MALPIAIIGPYALLRAGAALLVAVLLAMVFAVATVVAWLYAWEDVVSQLGWAAPGPVMQGVLRLETALPPGQVLPSDPTAGGIVPLGDYRWGSGSATFCELYAEQLTGLGNQGVSAAAAAQRFQSLGLLHPGMPPEPGDLVYFGPAPDNEGFGHVGLSLGDGRFRSITAYGLADAPLAGWRAPYLGWVDPTTIGTDRFGRAVRPERSV